MINKKLNQNLQITLSKESVLKLEQIKKEYEKKFNLQITKSQTIKLLIDSATINQKTTPNQKNKIKDIDIKILELQKKLNLNNIEFSNLLKINKESLRKYINKISYPNIETLNKIIILFEENKINYKYE